MRLSQQCSPAQVDTGTPSQARCAPLIVAKRTEHGQTPGTLVISVPCFTHTCPCKVSLPPPRPLRVCVRVCKDDPCGNLQPEQESSASWILLCKAAAIMGCAARGSVNGTLNWHVREAGGRAHQEPPAGDRHGVHRRPDCCWHGGTGRHLSAQGLNSLGLDLSATCNTLATNRYGSCLLRCKSASLTYLIRKQHPRKEEAWKIVGKTVGLSQASCRAAALS